MQNILNGAAVFADSEFAVANDEQLNNTALYRLRAINFEANKHYLKNKPFKQVLDLALIVFIDLGNDRRSALTDVDLQNLEVSFEQFVEAAYDNFRNKIFIYSECDYISGLMEYDPDDVLPEYYDGEDGLYIIGNSHQPEATALLGNQQWLEDKHKEYGDYYIFPLSCHEILLAPTELGRAARALPIQGLVNEGRVTPGEVLSINIYKYDGTLSIVSASDIDDDWC